MTDAKCPWCGAVVTCRATHNMLFECGSSDNAGWGRSQKCKDAELAQHKQRLMDQSAKLAAAEAELRRLRQVIEAAPRFMAFRDDCTGRLEIGPYGDVPCKLVPLDELEATC